MFVRLIRANDSSNQQNRRERQPPQVSLPTLCIERVLVVERQDDLRRTVQPSNLAMLSIISPQTSAKVVGSRGTTVDHVLVMAFDDLRGVLNAHAVGLDGKWPDLSGGARRASDPRAGRHGVENQVSVDLEQGRLIQSTRAARFPRSDRAKRTARRDHVTGGISMPDSQAKLKPYLQIIDSVSLQLSQIKQLLNDPDQCLTDSDAKSQVGGQLANLAEEFGNLAKEIE
jgi:hypothetical protein